MPSDMMTVSRLRADRSPGDALAAIETVQAAIPEPGPGEVRMRVRASSLNYHDLAVATGMIPTSGARVLLSDGAGEIDALGDGADKWRVGDRVLSTFFPNWAEGTPSLPKLLGVPGDHADGFAAQYVCVPEASLTHMPSHMSFAEAATLPCAALTAWRALAEEARVQPGQTVLVQGSGGVSVAALQLAKAMGATVIATSSSDAKLERLRELGADHVINYKTEPNWGDRAKALTNGVGVDEVIEVGGPGTLAQSIKASRIGGHITLIGVLTGISGEVPTAALFSSNITLAGVTVGSHAMQRALVAFTEAHDIKPVIDRSFALDTLAAAFAHQISGRHFGKIVIEI